jgi:2-dehydro-3-deoxyphosphogluconate aldolase/(4S)-4-hydroxy-2-oxoglutarate aldolase
VADQTTASQVVAIAPVLPVVTVSTPDEGVRTAAALQDGGIGVMEVTLRTPGALAAIRRITREVPGVVVGAGTVHRPDQVTAAVDAGALFLVSPGITPLLAASLAAAPVPAVPGTATVHDMLLAAEHGMTVQKFFPAAVAGGSGFLAAVHGPLPDLVFCPTGGIRLETAPEWLALPNVACVGGSWIAPPTLVEAGAFADITRRARVAAGLRSEKRIGACGSRPSTL